MKKKTWDTHPLFNHNIKKQSFDQKFILIEKLRHEITDVHKWQKCPRNACTRFWLIVVKKKKKRRPKFTISSKYREDAYGMQHFTPMRTFHPFVWHPLWSKTICCYCLMQTHKTRKIVKTNKSKFWDLYPHSKITLIIWFLSFFVL